VVIEGPDLRTVSAGEYDLICLPVRFAGREAAPARVIVRPRHGKSNCTGGSPSLA